MNSALANGLTIKGPPPGPHPKDVGDVSHAQVLAALVKAGKTVLVPFGDNQRYDVAIDEGGVLVRVQSKTGVLRGGAVRFPVCSTDWYRRTTRTYAGEIEFFGVYCAGTGKVYLVPVDLVGRKEASLRVEAPRNHQARRIRWAKDYEL